MKILWHSNAPEPLSATGYGNQTGLFCPRIRDLGHQVVISAMTGVSGFPTNWEGIPILPAGLTPFSGDIVGEHARRFFGRGPGLVIVHYDAWAIGAESVAGLPTAAWSPVHSDRMSRGDRVFYAASGAVPITYSRHGEEQMRRAGLHPHYVPHGVDTRVYRPLDDEERRKARDRFGIADDAFVLSMVAANKGQNPGRKGWGETLAAFAAFRRQHPEAVLLVHTMKNQPSGLDLESIMRHWDIPGDGTAVVFSDLYSQVIGTYDAEYVATLTGCSDVFVNPSYGEGFGLGILQAQACGVPVIVGSNSAQPELCEAGWQVECQPYWYPDDDACWAVPSIRGIEQAMEQAWQLAQPAKAAKRAKWAQRARSFAEQFDADVVTERYWKPLLDMLAQYCGAARVKPLPAAGPRLPTTEVDGLTWVYRGQHTDDWIVADHEALLGPILDDHLPEGGVFLDVGAHVGRWSLRLAAKASKVIAVEPNPDTAAVWRANAALNGITNAEVIEVAAWDERARVRLEDPNVKSTGGSTRVFADETGTVEALPLDVVLGDVDRIDLVKLDVEGADLRALAGMAGMLARLRPVVIIEDHSIYGYYEHEDLVAAVAALGYEPRPFTVPLSGGFAPYVLAVPGRGSDERNSTDG